jgi:hypothetical protein
MPTLQLSTNTSLSTAPEPRPPLLRNTISQASSEARIQTPSSVGRIGTRWVDLFAAKDQSFVRLLQALEFTIDGGADRASATSQEYQTDRDGPRLVQELLLF